MNTQNFTNTVVIPRQHQERRKNSNSELPFITEEGLVLVDRRESRERRLEEGNEAWQKTTLAPYGLRRHS